MSVRTVRTSVRIIFFVYIVCLLWVLFLSNAVGRISYGEFIYWETYVRDHINLIPFHTIWGYLARMFQSSVSGRNMVVECLINVLGNIAVFVPMGLLLPTLFRPPRRLSVLVITISITVILAELLQVAFMCGSCDIDDFILNVIGAVFGFCLFRNFRQKRWFIKTGLVGYADTQHLERSCDNNGTQKNTDCR